MFRLLVMLLCWMVVSATALAEALKKKLDAEVPATYRASVDYTNQSFDSGPSSWNTVALASERRDERVALIGRASYVNRYDESMLQLDAEAYPTLGEQTYAHLLTSYATGDILHDFKPGVGCRCDKFSAGRQIGIVVTRCHQHWHREPRDCCRKVEFSRGCHG